MYSNKILVVTDFSDESTSAFPLAKLEASKSKSELTLAHVLEPLYLPVGTEGIMPPPEYMEEMETASREASNVKLREMASTYFPHQSVTLATLKWSGEPYRAIANFARENHFGLIIVASQGKGAFRRFFLGTTAEGLVRHAHCPVLIVVRDENALIPRGSYKRILVTTDFSEDSKDAFKYAVFEAKLNDAQLTLGYVMEDLMSPEVFKLNEKLTSDYDIEAMQEAHIRLREAKFEQFAKDNFSSRSVKTSLMRKNLSIATTIVEYAKSNQVDLIVLGTHGTGRGINLLGGVAERIVRQTECPVLVIPKKDRGSSS